MGAIFGFISKYQIFGVIPLDLTLHFFIGMIWTIVGLKKNISIGKVALGLFIIAAGKEANDFFFHYRTHWSEYASDFGITMLYVVVVYFVRKTKKKLEPKSKDKWKVY
jgi:hypothetical protein